MDAKLLLGLFAAGFTVLSAVVGFLWARIVKNEDGIQRVIQSGNDDRVAMGEKFVTSEEVDRRLGLHMDPVNQRLVRMEKQNDEILRELRAHYREAG